MKNNIKFNLLLFALALLGNSCKEAWVETPIYSLNSVENFYKTSADADQAVIAAYSILKTAALPTGATDIDKGSIHGLDSYFTFGEICSDDAEKGGENRANGIDLAELKECIANGDNGSVKDFWKMAYIGLYRCNVALQYVPNIPFSKSDTLANGVSRKKRLLAEVQFIRAYLNFYLVRVFGDVPLVDHVLPPSEYKIGRTPKSKVYAAIESDLKDAIPFLSKKKEYSIDQMGRVTKGAAQALLGKVYLYEEKWSEAEPMFKAVMDDGSYDLNTPYSKIFSLAGENSTESVFEVQFRPSGGWNNLSDGNTFAIFTGSRDARWPIKDGGWGFMLPNQNLVKEFEPGDPRLDETIVFNGEPNDRFGGTEDTLYTDYVNDPKATSKTNPTGMICQKFLCNTKRLTGENWSSNPNNLPIIRFADVVLMYAEACYHNGKEAEARTSVNSVRARARKEAKDPAALPDVTASGEALLQAIWHERRVELALEGHRFFDLVRTRRAAEVINNYWANNAVQTLNNPFKEGVHELFPIPLSAIEMSDGAVKQNPGYN